MASRRPNPQAIIEARRKEEEHRNSIQRGIDASNKARGFADWCVVAPQFRLVQKCTYRPPLVPKSLFLISSTSLCVPIPISPFANKQGGQIGRRFCEPRRSEANARGARARARQPRGTAPFAGRAARRRRAAVQDRAGCAHRDTRASARSPDGQGAGSEGRARERPRCTRAREAHSAHAVRSARVSCPPCSPHHIHVHFIGNMKTLRLAHFPEFFIRLSEPSPFLTRGSDSHFSPPSHQ
jgi:hypothetical protein